MLAVGATAAAVTGGRAWGELLPRLEREGAAGRFVHDHGPGHLLRHPEAPSHYLEAVSALAARDGGDAAGWFDDDLFLCLHPHPAAETPPDRRPDRRDASGGPVPPPGEARVWQRVPGTTGFTDITPRLPALLRRYCAEIRDRAPLAARFEWRGARLAWRLGPYPGGGWAFVFADGRTRVEVPRRGDLRLGARRGAELRVRYRDPAGWVTYSPELRLDFTTRGGLEWAR